MAGGKTVPARASRLREAGAVEGFGLLDAHGGRCCCEGWCDAPWDAAAAADELVLLTGLGRLTGPATSLFVPQVGGSQGWGLALALVALLRIPPVPRLELEALELRRPAGRLPVAPEGPLMPQARRRGSCAGRCATRRRRRGPCCFRQAPRLALDATLTLSRLGASAVHVTWTG
jgi:hypothetical protein